MRTASLYPPGVVFPPKRRHDDMLYSNSEHILNEMVATALAHNQSMYAMHEAGTYHGCVYCAIEEGAVMWFEEVYQFGASVAIYRALDVTDLIAGVMEEFGYA